MKVLASKKPKTYSKVMGIDASSNKIAMTMLDKNGIVMTAKIELGDGDIFHRMGAGNRRLKPFLQAYRPDFILIEQTVYVQNIETVRKLSYVVGSIMATIMREGIDVDDVPPISWKSFMGAKSITKQEKMKYINEMGELEAKKFMAKRRKSQVQDMLRKRFPEYNWDDNDIADSCGIALYAWDKYATID